MLVTGLTFGYVRIVLSLAGKKGETPSVMASYAREALQVFIRL